jgi:hypothetical protein
LKGNHADWVSILWKDELRRLARSRAGSRIEAYRTRPIIGAISGIIVVTMATGVDVLNTLFFALAPGEQLSPRG